MTYVWLQQWVALPVIVEEHMGDTSHNGGLAPSGPFQHQYQLDDSEQGYPKQEGPFQLPRSMSGNSPFYSQYSAFSNPQQRMDNSRFQYAAGGNSSQAGSSFHMGAVASALPDYSSQTQSTQNSRPQSSGQPRAANTSTPAMVYQMQQNLQYPHQSGTNFPSQGGLGGYGHSQFSGYGQSPSSQGGPFPQMQQQRIGGLPQQYTGYSPLSPQYYYFPGASPGYSSMPYGPGASLQSSMIGRGMPGMQASLNNEGQDGYLGAESLYPGE